MSTATAPTTAPVTGSAAGRPETVYQREIRRAREQFEAEVTIEKQWGPAHQMRILRDETAPGGTGEPYRHVRFSKPGTGLWSFDLVTWPGHLAISGDIGSFTFARLHDMFDFFRGTRAVNASYWGEKVIAGARGTDRGQTRYSAEAFIEQVNETIDDAWDSYEPEDFEALKQAAREALLDDAPEYLEEAHQALADFTFDPDNGDPEFRFSDTWEWDLAGYDHHYLLAIHAIQWGVNTYLAAHPERLIREAAPQPVSPA